MNTTGIYNKDRHSLPRLWLQYLNANVLKRALRLALIIGCTLTLINQFDALFGNASFKQLSLILVFVTPFVVITISQLVATHRAVSDSICGQISEKNTPFIITLMSHGILFRALLISFIIGSVNSLFILIDTFYQTTSIANAPLPLLAQVYILPFIFGTLSQALAYRRYVARPTFYLAVSQENNQ